MFYSRCDNIYRRIDGLSFSLSPQKTKTAAELEREQKYWSTRSGSSSVTLSLCPSYIARQMGRSPCCAKEGLNRGAWTAMEDRTLTEYITTHGEGKWRNLPKRAGKQLYV